LKLLLVQNLSTALVQVLSDVFPQSQHVARLGLDRVQDRGVWEYARDNGYILVSKDSDFHDLSVLYGAPPKIV
jgi:predicted nuclease of predicted toxin-antitoxin system